MKIAFDAKRITHNATGLGNYSRYIVNTLAGYYPENEYVLYSPGPGREDLRNRLLSDANFTFHYPNTIFSRTFPALWRSQFIGKQLQKDQVEIFHGLSNEIPFSLDKYHIPSVVTIHDLIFLRCPECYKKADHAIYNFKYGKSARKATRIIAVSKKTKEDMIEYWKIPESKIDVVYQGCDDSFKKQASLQEKEHIKQKYEITTPYILYVGSIEERKNLLLLIQALKDIKQDIAVVAIGRATGYTQKITGYIRENKLQSRVHLLHNVSFAELPAFYQGAEVFVYPSFYEGFGIPLLEALCSGIPAIGATGSCLEEAGGPHSLYTDPRDSTQLRDLIENVLNTPALSQQMIREGLLYAEKFTPVQLASDIMDVYKKTFIFAK